jgi:PhoPQ-activated pathogenicity-related protein
VSTNLLLLIKFDSIHVQVHKRGLDIMAEVAKEKVPETNIDKFIVTGASKRGWTALSIAATDQRVEMCLPIVFTLMNMKEVISYLQSRLFFRKQSSFAPFSYSWFSCLSNEI